MFAMWDMLFTVRGHQLKVTIYELKDHTELTFHLLMQYDGLQIKTAGNNIWVDSYRYD